jgi:hypothetical protein
MARTLWTFLSISLAFHLLVALLWIGAAQAPEPAKERSLVGLEVELVHPPRRSEPRVRPRLRRPVRTWTRKPTHAHKATARTRPRAGRSRRAEPDAPQRSTSSSLSLKMRGLDLALDSRRFLRPPPPPRPRRGARNRDSSISRDEATKERLDRLLAADQALRNVRTGRVDPRLYEIQRDSETFFSPSWSLTRGSGRGLGTVSATLKELLRVMGKKYLENLERYTAAQRVPSEVKTESTFTEVYNDVLHSEEEGGRDVSLACSLCADVGFGMAPRITITRRSGQGAFDRLAHSALLQAVKRRPPPKGSRPVRACYRFVAKFFRVPPMPFIGGTFDESKPSIEVFYPLKKILRTRVKLQTAQYLVGPG